MAETSSTILPRVEDTIKRVGGMASLSCDQDFYDAGLTSLASLTLLLELEDEFSITISDEQFIRCRTAAEIVTMIEERTV